MVLRLGIDIGTSGVRTAVLDEDGCVLSMAQAEHLPQYPDGIDAEKWWIAVQNCIHSQVDALGAIDRSGDEISGIAVDGTSGTMVITDAALNPVSRALMYDSSGFEREAERVAAFAPDIHITKGSNSALARAMHLANETEASPVHLLHQADFIAAKLTGRGGVSDHNNALKTGFDPELDAWPDWIDPLIDPDLLPDPFPVGAVIGTVTPDAAHGLGLSADALVYAGTTDSIAGFLATAPLRIGVAVTSLGSTLAVKCLVPTRIEDPSIGLYSHRLGNSWLAGGASNTGGAVLARFFSAGRLRRLSSEMDTDSITGLDYYPLLRPGERFPINDPQLRPRLEPRPAQDVLFLQGLFEGMARIEADCYRSIEERGGGYPEAVFSAGGGADNPAWSRIRGRELGFAPMSARSTEACVGVARLACA